MKRIYVQEGIYIVVNNSGTVPKKCFEVAKRRTFPTLPSAIKLFKFLHRKYDSVYMYHTKAGFMVEFKTYAESLGIAQDIKNDIEATLEVFENDK
ncbi:TPA: hypothetical protein K8M77_000337 [Clostridium perfringens]|nr:hypothetical protein [Clostridium perfringens]